MSEIAGMSAGSQPHRLCSRTWARRLKAASASAGRGFWAASTRSRPSRRTDRMRSAVGASRGATLDPAALLQSPGAPSMRRGTRPTTDARLRGAERRGATRAHTWWPDARTVRVHTSPRRMCARRRERPDRRPRGEGRPPPMQAAGCRRTTRLRAPRHRTGEGWRRK